MHGRNLQPRYWFTAGVALLLLPGCQSRSEQFENAWMGNCYDRPVTYATVGNVLSGAPGQIDVPEGYWTGDAVR